MNSDTNSSESDIKLRDCLDRMDAGLSFSLVFAQYDEKRRNKNGKISRLHEAIALRHVEKLIAATTTTGDVSDSYSEKKTATVVPCNPNHRDNMTRNVKMLIAGIPVGDPIKIHLDLLLRFDGRKVKLP